jgi:nucleoid DNA-binding protein
MIRFLRWLVGAGLEHLANNNPAPAQIWIRRFSRVRTVSKLPCASPRPLRLLRRGVSGVAGKRPRAVIRCPTLSEIRGIAGNYSRPDQSERVLEAVVDVLKQALQRGEKIDLHGLGVFKVRQTKPRQGRNPRTGEALSVGQCIGNI